MIDLFRRAGWVAWPLALYSILGLGILLERLFTLSRLQTEGAREYARLLAAAQGGEPLPPGQVTPASTPVEQILAAVQPLLGYGDEAVQQACAAAIAIQRLRLRRYLSTLATISSTAPFIGLFGTVLGVIAAFQSMSRSGLSGESMAAGISEALSATAVGLLVAIPAVISYNLLSVRVQAQILQIQGQVARLLPLLQKQHSREAEHARIRA